MQRVLSNTNCNNINNTNITIKNCITGSYEKVPALFKITLTKSIKDKPVKWSV